MRFRQFRTIIAVCFPLLLFGYMTVGAADELTVKGAIYGAQWDDKGNVLSVSILTTEGDELFVEHTSMGDELLKLVEQNIKVTGTVQPEKDGKKLFTVTKYEIAFN